MDNRHVVKSTTFDIYLRLIPYSIVLAASILFYRLEVVVKVLYFRGHNVKSHPNRLNQMDVKKAILLMLLFGLSSCLTKGNKNKHLSTVKIHEVKGSQGKIVLYVERFSDLGKGASGE